MIRRIRITIAYDGTDYCGWALQNGQPSVADELYKAISSLTGETRDIIHLIGASRTDSGVHAKCNVAVFETASKIPAGKFAPALNTRLPDDIRVMSSVQCADDWHPRHIPAVKTYSYKIYNNAVNDPLLRRTSHFTYFILDIDAMRKAAALLTGEHDFTSFTNPGSQVLLSGGNAVRTIYNIDINSELNCPEGFKGLITITFRGNGFLYNMVRIIAGTLLETGMGHIRPESITEILESKDRSKAGPTAPARGLTLEEIEFNRI